ncbi:riboflavin biosynthesis protein RibD, partial [Campylobacter lari]|nr:riboflavin biosynthesis protein RibD [Campylobacter lari]
MRLAVDLASCGKRTVRSNPLVGCVIVNDGEVVGQGFHRRRGEAHAEVHALDHAGERARGGTAYVSL